MLLTHSSQTVLSDARGTTFQILGEHVDTETAAELVNDEILRMIDAGERPEITRTVSSSEIASAIEYRWVLPFGGTSYLDVVPETNAPVTELTPGAAPLTRIAL